MVQFTTHILDKKSEIGWVYVIVPADVAIKLHSEDKKAFRIKGKIDDYAFEGVGLLPAGDGEYILAIKAAIRKAIGKKPGDKVTFLLEKDEAEYQLPELLLTCLEDEPEASAFFYSLPKGHQRYYGNWIDTARTEDTKVKRVAETINALLRKQHFGQMMQYKKAQKKEG